MLYAPGPGVIRVSLKGTREDVPIFAEGWPCMHPIVSYAPGPGVVEFRNESRDAVPILNLGEMSNFVEFGL
jgi:hypothetical protein